MARSFASPSLLSLPITLSILVHVYLSPYTKVEESFNIQATHDILNYGVPFSNVSRLDLYDHVDFPGAVPRTFLGSIVLAGVTLPWTGFLSDPASTQAFVRTALGMFNAFALNVFADAVSEAYDDCAGIWFIFLQSSQFHLMYYASRTLPNMFAFGLTTIALAALFRASSPKSAPAMRPRRVRMGVYLLAIAATVFRSEIALLLAFQCLDLLIGGHASLRDIIRPGILGSLIGMALSVSIDSFFWNQWPVWPELYAFYFNAILGKSSDWGAESFWFYFTRSIPKLLFNPIIQQLTVPTAMLSQDLRQATKSFLVPSVFFTAAYSLLPHKEWRFIIYTIPAWTGVAAGGASRLWANRRINFFYMAASAILVISVIGSYLGSFIFLYVSSLNYPGGEALARLHASAQADPVMQQRAAISVHIDNLSAQTGVTRFLQHHPFVDVSGHILPFDTETVIPEHIQSSGASQIWLYDKTENQTLLLDPIFWRRIDYALMERPEKTIGQWDIIETIYGFGGITITSMQEFERGLKKVQGPASGHERWRFLHRALDLWTPFERQLRQKVTKGKWVGIRMVPRVNIMKRRPLQRRDVWVEYGVE